MSRTIHVAAAQYPIESLASATAWADKLARWVDEAASAGAQLLVFPEYASMEAASFLLSSPSQDVAAHLDAVVDHAERADAVLAELAARRGVWILGASAPVRVHGRLHNRATLFGPSGARGHQDKRVMTRFEREQWGVVGGESFAVFDTPLCTLGVAICYDAEFPAIARRLAVAGAEVLLVPSCTDTARGYFRVRTGAQARALENQIAVVHAPTVGLAPWSPAVDVNVGAAAVYVPPDLDFPDDGVLAIGVRDAPQWVHAEIDLDRLARCRVAGDVLNARDWPEQDALDGCARVRVE